MENQALQKEFIEGTVPNMLEGYYHGSIEEMYPSNTGESIVYSLNSVWSLWKGKVFYTNGRGDNVLSSALMWIIRIRFGNFFDDLHKDKMFHAFPFQATYSASLFDERPVLQLSYNMPQNPQYIRGAIDEIVWTNDKIYLGKMYIKTQDSYRLKAWFRLYSS